MLLIEQSRFCHMSCLSFAFCAILLIYNLPAVLTCTVIDDADDAVHYTSKKTKFNWRSVKLLAQSEHLILEGISIGELLD